MSRLTESELRVLLKSALSHKNLEDLCVSISGDAEKGEGYLGDIIFAQIRALKHGVSKTYDVVLKCGKRSQILRENSPVRESYDNEIYVYRKVFPELKQFAEKKCSSLVFDCVPRCLGTYSDGKIELIVLEDLKKTGYTMWDRQKPASLELLKIMLPLYGKWHALSSALRDQEPEHFKNLANRLSYMWSIFGEKMNLNRLFGSHIEEGYNLLKNELDDALMYVWEHFKDKAEEILVNQTSRRDCFTVITHGDCWINNFMFKFEDSGKILEPVFIDWQVSSENSPICDVSYFLYASIAPDDLNEHFDSLLKVYHDSFSFYARELGSDPQKLYPYEQFLIDWKRFARYGILMAPMVYKMTLIEKDEAPDVTKSMESGKNFEESFDMRLKDNTMQKLRLKTLIEHAVQRGLI